MMKSARLFPSAILLLIGMFSFGVSSASAGYPEKINGFLDRLSSEGLSAAVLVIDSSGRVARGCGMADRENNRAITPQTLFDIGSVTKQFTGAAIVALVEDGKLSFTDSLAKFWPTISKEKAGITLHMLLTHTSGFRDALGDDYDSLDRETFLIRALEQPLSFQPGDKFQYSNLGYSVLAAIIEKVTGTSYEKYLRERLFLPAGMERTGYSLMNTPESLIAIGYRADDRWGRPTEKRWGKDAPYWNLVGNGGILSSIEDMEKWHLALRSTKVLSEASKKIYLHPHVSEQQGGSPWYAYGWGVVESPRKTMLITHNGSNGIFYASMLQYFTEGLTIVVLSNALTDEVRNLSFELAKQRFIPDYISELSIAGLTDVADPYSDSNGKVFMDLVQTLQDGSIEKIVRFIDSFMHDRLRQAADLQGHINVLQQIGSEVRGLKMQQVQRKGSEWSIRFADSPVRLVATMQDGKLANLGVN